MSLGPYELAVLSGMAFATSVLSAAVGMAGGITLLSVMLLYLEPLAAIPLHGVIQLVSNGSRAAIQRSHVDWSLTWRYGLLILPMGALGLKFAFSLPPHLTTLVIGCFVLLATWRPEWLRLGAHPERTERGRRFLALGGAVGFLGVVVGATGPLIAPFFLNLGLPRQGVIGTKAACQTLSHLAKIILFGLTGFVFSEFAEALLIMSVLVGAGTWVGSRMLDRVDERVFIVIYKTVLSAIALRLLAWDGWLWWIDG